jgi:hypothetical protein
LRWFKPQSKLVNMLLLSIVPTPTLSVAPRLQMVSWLHVSFASRADVPFASLADA